MKQIDDCLNRVFESKQQLKSSKWKAFYDKNDSDKIMLFHYHHLVLIYNLKEHEVEYKWYECLTDKRGLNAAIIYLNNKFGISLYRGIAE